MDSNTYSTSRSTGEPVGLAALETVVDRLAAHDLDRLADTALVERARVLRGLGDRLEGQWLRTLAAVDARGAAGAEDGVPAGSTAGWLRRRLRLSAGAATSCVRTARALFRGPLAGTGRALVAGEVSLAHAQVLAHSTQELPAQVAREAEPVLLEAARRLDPPQLRRAVAHLRLVADPEGADRDRDRRFQQRGVWLSATWEGMVAVQGLLDPEAGQTLAAALEPLARPATAHDTRSGGQRRADALTELARRQLEGGRLPRAGGVRPQLLVTVDLDSLLGHPGGVGGEAGEGWPLDPEACQRLACDGAVTRVLVTRQPPGPGDHGGDDLDPLPDPDLDTSLAARLRVAATRLPPTLGGAPSQPLEVGRTTRVVSAAQRHALVVRDRGCVFPGCERPPGWCEAHHLVHWLHGGPTDLPNLALVCRAHHRAVHEGGWRLHRDPDGRLVATPPHRQPRRQPAAV
jgi:Domain of unknown function (DUF222)/HNH endonuclease